MKTRFIFLSFAFSVVVLVVDEWAKFFESPFYFMWFESAGVCNFSIKW
jgi:hypothetical protein